MIRKEEMIKVGQFMKPHGVKGEIALRTAYDLFDGTDAEDLFLFCEMDGILVPFFVESFRPKSATLTLVKLENIDTERRAAELANLEVLYPKEKLGEEDGEWAWDYFIGFRVVDAQRGEIGVVTEVDDSTMNVLLRIDTGTEKEFLLPAVKEFIRSIDTEKEELRVSFPDGLLDL